MLKKWEAQETSSNLSKLAMGAASKKRKRIAAKAPSDDGDLREIIELPDEDVEAVDDKLEEQLQAELSEARRRKISK